MKKARMCLGIIGFISFLLMFVCVGYIENDTINLSHGFILVFIFLVLWGLCVAASNALDKMELQQRYKQGTYQNKKFYSQK